MIKTVKKTILLNATIISLFSTSCFSMNLPHLKEEAQKQLHLELNDKEITMIVEDARWSFQKKTIIPEGRESDIKFFFNSASVPGILNSLIEMGYEDLIYLFLKKFDSYVSTEALFQTTPYGDPILFELASNGYYNVLYSLAHNPNVDLYRSNNKDKTIIDFIFRNPTMKNPKMTEDEIEKNKKQTIDLLWETHPGLFFRDNSFNQNINRLFSEQKSTLTDYLSSKFSTPIQIEKQSEEINDSAICLPLLESDEDFLYYLPKIGINYDLFLNKPNKEKDEIAIHYFIESIYYSITSKKLTLDQKKYTKSINLSNALYLLNNKPSLLTCKGAQNHTPAELLMTLHEKNHIKLDESFYHSLLEGDSKNQTQHMPPKTKIEVEKKQVPLSKSPTPQYTSSFNASNPFYLLGMMQNIQNTLSFLNQSPEELLAQTLINNYISPQKSFEDNLPSVLKRQRDFLSDDEPAQKKQKPSMENTPVLKRQREFLPEDEPAQKKLKTPAELLLYVANVLNRNQDLIDENGETMAHIFARNGFYEGLEFLSSKLPSLMDIENSEGQTPLQILIKNHLKSDITWGLEDPVYRLVLKMLINSECTPQNRTFEMAIRNDYALLAGLIIEATTLLESGILNNNEEAIKNIRLTDLSLEMIDHILTIQKDRFPKLAHSIHSINDIADDLYKSKFRADRVRQQEIEERLKILNKLKNIFVKHK